VCKHLSLWVTGGKKEDVFWRSAMSGGRATVGGRKGKDLARQAGDITSVAPEGHLLTDDYYIECKFYRDLRLDAFLLGKGPLAKMWKTALTEAKRYKRSAMLIARQNNTPTLMLVQDDHTTRYHFTGVGGKAVTYMGDSVAVVNPLECLVYLFDDVTKVR
jgi:hypothetical protein